MRYLACLTLLVILAQPAVAQDAVLKAHHVDAWSNVHSVQFTWKHEASGHERSYDWNLKKGVVAVKMGDKSFTIPTTSTQLKDLELAAHQAFINDSYWLLFEIFLARDTVKVSDLGDVDVPGLKRQGHAYAVQYTNGGYTPGDRYVLYTKNGQVFAWAYHPKGSAEAKLVTTREGHQTFGALTIPTQFNKADGTRFITISNLKVSLK